ncbi:putative Phosphatidylinositol 4-phosphate 5-kinase 4 [Paratrimastix pyriformis]|uniref:Phosphatidylinositol 4-phosphate 5-kinase 4 n=1 Tax=Paratrimastix pyriformis TaxID=342808 RepID=A0ABQ8UTC2_9EUKA|nr:putative Phosphatidylinositol 4-phosphate 5-kinase 4 [Paratrimastix pyriformis]
MHGRGLYRWADGSEYTGDFREGCMHGMGIRTWPNGKRYQGQFRGDKMWGEGEEAWPSGEKYVGSFVSGVYHGVGKRFWPNGDVYYGAFRDGHEEGEGTFESTEGWVYRGQWVAGQMHGEGEIKWADGRLYHGQWHNGLRSGMGQMYFPDGSSYEGEFRNNDITGHGVRTFTDGSKYVGHFEAGTMNGEGTYTWRDGTVYEGQWRQGCIFGQGTRTFPDGVVLAGAFTESGISGHGTKKWPNGCSYVGSFLRLHSLQGKQLQITKCRPPIMHGDLDVVCHSIIPMLVRLAIPCRAGIDCFACRMSRRPPIHPFPSAHLTCRAGIVLSDPSIPIRSPDLPGWGCLVLYCLQNVMHGHGIFVWPDGRRFEGNFNNGVMEGQGVLEWIEGPGLQTYEGAFKENLFHGKGSLYGPTGGSFHGHYREGRLVGIGSLTMPNGVEFKGSVDKGGASGIGDGRVYVGEFRDDLECGRGAFTDGDVRIMGQWEAGDILEQIVEVSTAEGQSLALCKPPTMTDGEVAALDGIAAAVEVPHGPVPSAAVPMSSPEPGMGPPGFEPGCDAGSGQGGMSPTASSAPTPSELCHHAPPRRLATILVHAPPQRLGKQLNGKHIILYVNGDKYIGEFSNGMKNGEGVYIYASLRAYKGIWKDDCLDGVRHPVTDADLPPLPERQPAPAPPPPAPTSARSSPRPPATATATASPTPAILPPLGATATGAEATGSTRPPAVLAPSSARSESRSRSGTSSRTSVPPLRLPSITPAQPPTGPSLLARLPNEG